MKILKNLFFQVIYALLTLICIKADEYLRCRNLGNKFVN